MKRENARAVAMTRQAQEEPIDRTTPETVQIPSSGAALGSGAFDRRMPALYEQLKQIAAGQLWRERSSHTLNPTALVHEAYLKLANQPHIELRDRAHLLALTARAMRRILVDYARSRKTAKRGGAWIRTTLSGKARAQETDPEELLALDAALDQLEPRQREIVELKFFSGLTHDEIGVVLGISARTVRRDWVKARAWLYSELYPES